jgi:hypothetical protein
MKIETVESGVRPRKSRHTAACLRRVFPAVGMKNPNTFLSLDEDGGVRPATRAWERENNPWLLGRSALEHRINR